MLVTVGKKDEDEILQSHIIQSQREQFSNKAMPQPKYFEQKSTESTQRVQHTATMRVAILESYWNWVVGNLEEVFWFSTRYTHPKIDMLTYLKIFETWYSSEIYPKKNKTKNNIKTYSNSTYFWGRASFFLILIYFKIIFLFRAFYYFSLKSCRSARRENFVVLLKVAGTRTHFFLSNLHHAVQGLKFRTPSSTLISPTHISRIPHKKKYCVQNILQQQPARTPISEWHHAPLGDGTNFSVVVECVLSYIGGEKSHSLDPYCNEPVVHTYV